jgi:GNAT superfamily N-acetyltransferase
MILPEQRSDSVAKLVVDRDNAMKASEAITIRIANAADRDAVVGVWNEVYFRDPTSDRETPYERTDFDDVSGRGEVFVATAKGAIIAVAGLLGPAAPGRVMARGEEAELVRVGVTGSARRRGVGAALVSHCLAPARERGWTAIALWSRPAQVAGHRLYESLGWRRSPERDSHDSGGEQVAFLLTFG